MDTAMRPSALPRRISNVLWAGMVFVVLGSAVVHWLAHRIGGQIISMLDRLTGYDQSGVIPTVYGSLLLFACSVALALIAFTKYTRRGVFVRHWAVLALAFAALGVDKALGIHHRITPAARGMQGMFHLSNGMVFLGIGLGALLGYVVYAQFLRSLAPRYRYQLLIAAVVFVVGGVLYDKASHVLVSQMDDGALLTQLVLAFEDALEIGGAILFLHALLEYIYELQFPFTLPKGRASFAAPTAQERVSTVDFSPRT